MHTTIKFLILAAVGLITACSTTVQKAVLVNPND